MPIAYPVQRLAKARKPKAKGNAPPVAENAASQGDGNTFRLTDSPEYKALPPAPEAAPRPKPIPKITYPQTPSAQAPAGDESQPEHSNARMTPDLEAMHNSLRSVEGVQDVKPYFYPDTGELRTIGLRLTRPESANPNSLFNTTPYLTPEQARLLAQTPGAHGHDLPPADPSLHMREPDASQYPMTHQGQNELEQAWQRWNIARKEHKEKLANYRQEVLQWKDRANKRRNQWRPPNYGAAAAAMQDKPQFQFSPQPSTEPFPLQDLGSPVLGNFLRDLDANDIDPREAARILADVRHTAAPEHERAAQALDLMHSSVSRDPGAKYLHSTPHGRQFGGDIPVGHARIASLPGAPFHFLQVHYPQGRVYSFRTQVNPEGKGYL